MGDRVRVLWQEPRGDKYIWWEGQVEQVRSKANGGELHVIRYDNEPTKVYVHDLRDDASSARHPWMILPGVGATAAPGNVPTQMATVTGPTTATTRARRAAMNMALTMESVLENLPEKEADACFRAMIYAALGDESAPYMRLRVRWLLSGRCC